MTHQVPTPLPDETPRHTINVPGDHVVRAAQENYTPDQAETVLWSFYRVREMEWSAASEFFGIEVDALHRVWRGKPQSDELARVLKRVAAIREKLGKNSPPRYARTNAAKLMYEACDRALELSNDEEPGFIFIGADAGAGKTTVQTAWHEDNNHGRSIYNEMDRVGGVKHIARQYAEQQGINRWLGTDDLYYRVKRSFKSRAGFPLRILQVDDAHKLLEPATLSLPKLEYHLGLVDTARLVIIFACAMDKFGQFLGLTAYNDKQFWRRCKYRVIVDEPASLEDIRILVRFMLPDLEPSSGLEVFLKTLNKHELGSFGEIAPVINEAQRQAKKRGRRVDNALLETVADERLKDLDKVKNRIRCDGRPLQQHVSSRPQPAETLT